MSTKSSQSCDQVKNFQQDTSVSEEPPGKQTVSVDSLQSKCSECAKTENQSNISSNFTGCRKDDEFGSFKTELPSEDSGLKNYAEEETGLKNNANCIQNSGSTGENCERNLVLMENTTKVSGGSQVLPQFCFPIARENKTVTTSTSSFIDLMPQENCNNGGSGDACKDKMFKLPSGTEDSTSKGSDIADQCKTENQSVLHSFDSEEKETEIEDQSGVIKACDLLKEGGLLYSDDLVLEEKAAKRSETSEHLTNVSENNRGRVIGKNMVEAFSDKKETYLQNKENVIHSEGLKSVDDCDMAIKIDLVHSERQMANEMLRKTLEQGQVTPDSVSLYVISDNGNCDKIVSSAIGVDAKDVNFNSKVQSHVN